MTVLEDPPVYVHFLGDGGDTAPRSSTKYAKNSPTSSRRRRLESSSSLLVGTTLWTVTRGGRVSRSPPSVRSGTRAKRLRTRLPQSRRGTKRMEGTRFSSQSSSVVMREESKPRRVTPSPSRLADPILGGDILFLFNDRSDRIREIATVLGKIDDGIDTKIPEGLDAFCPRAGLRILPLCRSTMPSSPSLSLIHLSA